MRNPCIVCDERGDICKTCFAGNVWRAYFAKRQKRIQHNRETERQYDGFVGDIRLKEGGNGHQW
jgi:hypothetical protein